MFNTLSRRLLVTVALSSAFVSHGRVPFGAAHLSAQGTEPATMYIAVVDKEGKPVPSLKPEQITIKMNNKERPIKSLEFVSTETGAAAAAAAPASKVPPPFGSNPKQPTGRVLLLYVDEESIRAGSEKALKDQLDAWVDTLPATDKIGLVPGAHGSNQVGIATNNREALHAGIAKIQSRRALANSSAECRTREAMDEMTSVVAAMQQFEGLKEILFFTNSMSPASSNAPIEVTSTATQGCNLSSAHIEKVAKALGLAQVHMYIVLPETLTDSNGVQNFSAVTSSPVVNMDTLETGALARIRRETAGYYIAGFDIASSERGSISMRLEVKSEGWSVHVPHEISFPKADAKSKPVAKDIIKENKIYTDVPIRVTTVIGKGTDETKVGVMVAIDRVEPGTKLSAGTVGLISPDGKILSWSLSGADLDKPALITSSNLVAPGPYKVRVAVNDAAGRAGTAELDINAELVPTSTMKMGGMILGAKQADGSVRPKLVFKDETEVAVVWELYGAVVAKGIDIKVEISAAPDGPAIVTAKATDDPPPIGISPAGAGLLKALATLPISKLEPGDYQVKVTFTFEGETPGVLTKTLRKVK